MKLTKPQMEALKDIASYPHGYPEYWKPKTRAKLVELGLAEPGRVVAWVGQTYQLTPAGRALLDEVER